MSSVRIGNVYARNLGVAPATTVHVLDPVTDWPTGRQLALMYTRKIEWVKKVTSVLEKSTVVIGRHDWKYLKLNKLTTHHPVTHNLIATEMGAVIAERLAWHHAGQLRLHIFKPSGGQWHEASTACSCGWRGSVRTGENTQSRIFAAQAFHLKQVEDGSFKPIGEELARILGRTETG